MTAQQIVALASRIFSIWMFTYTMRFIVSALGSDQQLGGNTSIIFYMMGLGMAVVAALAWLFPLAIAHKLVPRTQHTNIIRMPARQVAALAAVTLGVWVIIESMSYIAGLIRATQEPSYLFNGKELLYTVVALMPSAIGIYLIKNPFAVAARILPARAAGAQQQEQ